MDGMVDFLRDLGLVRGVGSGCGAGLCCSIYFWPWHLKEFKLARDTCFKLFLKIN